MDAGIAESSMVNGVMIWRPMLPHPKTLIIDYAHRYGVPYFKDSTPAWSTRGRLRNELLPLIAQVGPGLRGWSLEPRLKRQDEDIPGKDYRGMGGPFP